MKVHDMDSHINKKIVGTCRCELEIDLFYNLVVENQNLFNEVDSHVLFKLIKEMSISLATEVINCAVNSGCTEHIECSEFGKSLIKAVVSAKIKP
jgi:hypothetical protein